MTEKPSFNNESRERVRMALAIAFMGIYISLILTGILLDFFNTANPLIFQLLGLSMVFYGLAVFFVMFLYLMAVMQEYQDAETDDEINLIWNHKVKTKSFLKVKEDLYRRGTNLALVAAFAFPVTFVVAWLIPKNTNLGTVHTWLAFAGILVVIYWLSIMLIRWLYSSYEKRVEK